jgi:protein-glutamine gamma-glutamyltransferase
VTTNTQVAVLAPLRKDAGPHHRGVASPRDRPVIRLLAFGALGLYGVIRWGTLMNPAPTGRLLGMLAVALALAGLGPIVVERERTAAALRGAAQPLTAVGAPLALIAILAMFPIAGVPLAWALHLRVAITVDAIGQGLSALPGILVPYAGINQWVRVTILLGAAVLLLDAAFLLAFAPARLGDLRRAGAALPLIALVVVPDVSVYPHLAYLQGLVLFLLLAFFMWGERVAPDRRGGVVLALLTTGAVGMILAPALDRHSPWINTHNLTGGLTPAHVVRFDWTQRYGPLTWPRTGNTVLNVSATPKVWNGEYWKSENLDDFDGSGWAAGGVGSGAGLPGVSQRTLRRYSQNLTVTIRAMNTTQVIAAGYATQPPGHLTTPPVPGSSDGTWASATTLGPGDAYTVSAYTPHPSASALAKAGTNYPAGVRQGDLALTMPQDPSTERALPQTVVFPAFGSHGVPTDATGQAGFTGTLAIRSSPYSPAYTLAQGLARKSKTPYAFIQRVMSYLSPANNFSYDEYPPLTQHPLLTFLFENKLGYCQQFAGAMALLLRMGGIPARVSTGFTTGTYDQANKEWLVTDVDAHAWVEAWFPHYGWVTFDPTPAAAPARGGRIPISSVGSFTDQSQFQHQTRRVDNLSGSGGGSSPVHRAGSSDTFLFVFLGVLAALVATALLAWRRRAPLGPDGMLAELERALARSGRPIGIGVTLAAVERRFRTSPEAAAYVRALRAARFAGGTDVPTLGQRRALRAQLRAGLGIGGALRALWALPPRPHRRAPRK